MSTLSQLSEALAAVVESSRMAVVRVEGRRRLPASGIVWSSDGLVLTADHVVKRDEDIMIGLPDGRRLAAELVGRDATTDLALLRVDAGDLNPLAKVPEDSLSVGNLVLAIGRPGKKVQATLGIISALSEGWRTRRGGQIDRYLQTDVVMYPGFSGGPLIDANGGLVGLNTSAIARGVSVSIPRATLKRVAETITTHGRVRRGYLGISTQQVRLPQAWSETLGQKTGLLIVAVEPGSPAEKGGLVLGDTIVSVANHSVRHHDDLLAQLTGDRVGTSIGIGLLRANSEASVDVNLGERS